MLTTTLKFLLYMLAIGLACTSLCIFGYNIAKEQIDLPEEISRVNKYDNLRGYYDNHNILHIEFVNHHCIDSNHELCDGKCECDGMECSTSINK